MDGCIYRTQFNLCEKNKEEDEKKGIRRWCDFDGCEDKHLSNADRIRSMTDEELASKFEEVQLKTIKAYGNDDMLLAGELRKYWIDWLKQEVSNDECR